MFKKIIIFIAILFLILGIVFGVALYRVAKYDSIQGTLSLDINQREKSMLKKIAREITSWIYKEATIHNPEGDVLPDEIDDRIKEEVKNRVR